MTIRLLDSGRSSRNLVVGVHKSLKPQNELFKGKSLGHIPSCGRYYGHGMDWHRCNPRHFMIRASSPCYPDIDLSIAILHVRSEAPPTWTYPTRAKPIQVVDVRISNSVKAGGIHHIIVASNPYPTFHITGLVYLSAFRDRSSIHLHVVYLPKDQQLPRSRFKLVLLRLMIQSSNCNWGLSPDSDAISKSIHKDRSS